MEDENESIIDTEDETATELETNPDENWVEELPEEFITDLEVAVMDAMEEFIQESLITLYSPKFYDTMADYVISQILLIFEQMVENNETHKFADYKFHLHEITNYIDGLLELLLHSGGFIPRSYPIGGEPTISIDRLHINGRLAILEKEKVVQQNTQEWTNKRRELLTASTISKIFLSEKQQNTFIYNKCVELLTPSKTVDTTNSMPSSLEWGHKYEPLTKKIYEQKYNTTIGEYTCITHPVYQFMGASPDGININPNSEKYGRLVEIKNIWNREIEGIPKDDYWVQMQIQMETCDLDYCDFVETRFIEFNDEIEYKSSDKSTKGIILCFYDVNGTKKYEYSPIDATQKWINERININHDHILQEVRYWYLDEFSCVLVPRNREWFNLAIPEIKKVWNIIQTEKENGEYTKRYYNKNKVCLIKLEDDEYMNGDEDEL